MEENNKYIDIGKIKESQNKESNMSRNRYNSRISKVCHLWNF